VPCDLQAIPLTFRVPPLLELGVSSVAALIAVMVGTRTRLSLTHYLSRQRAAVLDVLPSFR